MNRLKGKNTTICVGTYSVTVTASLTVLKFIISSLMLDTGVSKSRLPVMSDLSIPVSSLITKDSLNVPLMTFSNLMRWTSI